MVLNFKDGYVKWDNTHLEMKSKAETFDLQKSDKLYSLFITLPNNDEPNEVKKASKRAEEILDAVYEKADINQIVNDCVHLSIDERNDLYRLLLKYESLFDGTLDEQNTTPISLQIKPGKKLYHSKVYPISYIYE